MTSQAAEAWLRRWDAQQERYIADREERFTVLCDVVEAALADVAEPVIVDLGCGPGSLAARLHERLPHARIIGIDSDPLLLGLARAHYRDGITWVDADLTTAGWQAEIPSVVHAAVSTTALHWLTEAQLADLYRTLGRVITRVFVNGDHIRLGDDRLDEIAGVVRHRRAARVGVEDNEEWGAWWDAVNDSPELATLAKARTDRRAHKDSHAENRLSIKEHSDLLRAAGFDSVAPLWQVGDDQVLVALKS
ncbi:class I SAM-dependent methyltransferase [Kibdelosporangium persicum]|uniref:Class I SAM-dependent methyltransferase n=1 Tax=Kibdelosporangium persicum TaxID=2698649 RepID=A0ABX2F2F6_9PSEU|nr:class I SAM-dependent methyltransferase [Kibdelosporangium persicum]NRN65526.1 Class I SAM-dependent methyltransferase [Kibdelosporangium persicum]